MENICNTVPDIIIINFILRTYYVSSTVLVFLLMYELILFSRSSYESVLDIRIRYQYFL